AGVGSAVNDTTRELGGALGIAILGSIANSAYRTAIDLGGLGLNAAAAQQSHESVGGAAVAASTMANGHAVTTRAASAFAHAFDVASVVSIGLALVAAVAVLVFSRPAREEQVVDDLDLELALELVPVRVGETRE